MLVKAKCIAPAWDNNLAQGYVVGEVYEIDTESDLASLTVTPVAYNAQGKPIRYARDGEGKTVEIPAPRPPYVFEFDRNANPDDKPHDYSCKKCVAHFKTLAALGSHTRSAHRDEAVVDDSEIEVVTDGRGKKKGKTFTCREPGCGVVLPHLYALKVHKKTHQGAVQV